MRSARKIRLVALLVPAFVAHLLCVCAQPAFAGSGGTQMRAGQAQASAHACCQRKAGGASQKSTNSQGTQCRYCSAPQLSPSDSPKLAGPAPSPMFVAPALASAPAIALAPSHLAPALQGSADPSRLRERTCVLLI
jgi:putative hemolysin